MKRRINEHSSLRNPQCCCQDNGDDDNNFDDDDDLLLGFERQMAKDYEMDGEAQTEKSERYIAATIITIIAIIITIIITITITIIITTGLNNIKSFSSGTKFFIGLYSRVNYTTHRPNQDVRCLF